MKTKKYKKLFSVLMLLCMLLNSVNVMAADEHLGEIVDGSELTEDLISETTVYPRTKGVFLANGTCTIANDGNHKISVGGTTSCYVTCDEVKITLVVERLVDGHWRSYKVIGTKIAYNNHIVTKEKQLEVLGGYYYRVVSAHVAIEDDKVETLGGATDGIWVKK